MYTKQEVLDNIELLVDPSNNKTLKENDAVKHLGIDEEKSVVNLVIALSEINEETEKTMKRQLAKLIKIELGFSGLKVDFELLAKSGTILEREVKYIGIASGKGGVGKSTVAANLAYALQTIGKKVGIIDADIYGSSIPTILDMPLTPPKATKEQKIIPYEKDGIEIISTEFFMTPDKPLMWRGPMLGKMLNHFFYDVVWSKDIEYIIVDLPPGTGDVAMDIQSLIPECKMLIVTTPHPSASHVAVKAGFAAEQLKHEIVGIVENMSYFTVNNEEIQIFGEGGGKIVADKLKSKVISTIPIGQPKSGHHSIFEKDEEIGLTYIGLANKLMKRL